MSSDFDQSDARELAEFAGLELEVVDDAISVEIELDNGKVIHRSFEPWDIYSSQWQIQSLKDAVREKGLEYEFIQKLWDELKTSHLDPHTGVDETERGMLVAETPPESICRAILEMEVD